MLLEWVYSLIAKMKIIKFVAKKCYNGKYWKIFKKTYIHTHTHIYLYVHTYTLKHAQLTYTYTRICVSLFINPPLSLSIYIYIYIRKKIVWMRKKTIWKITWKCFNIGMNLGLPNLIWSLRFLQLQQNYLNHLVTLLWLTVYSSFAPQMFLVAYTVSGPSSNV